ncbi:hypothetical protein [Actinomadura sp. HBU206391]|uniref:hypothetical protein n=1 Tax=Actinomadura sp. HBU206391 TaxID=2731692 RepID=UPI0016504B48|nr:hypothetical protein [Actinomadura sp. HBU206391]MBC6461163.1 hypothetical protein [Actinomadura sp. HBU206391]
MSAGSRYLVPAGRGPAGTADRHWMVTGRRQAATAALAALLDRSLVQIAAAAADARNFDRKTVHEVSDVWDNNTFPLFRVATARTEL